MPLLADVVTIVVIRVACLLKKLHLRSLKEMEIMNYITEINAFYQRQETNPLSSNAANLWHTFMHINNRTGWKRKFTVAVSVLCCKANLTNSTFKRGRKELRDKGYIRYESQSGNRAAIYQIVSSEESTMDQSNVPDAVDEQKVEGNFDVQAEVQSKEPQILDHKPVPLLKQKEAKQRTSTAAAEALEFFQENIGMISPYIREDLIKWVNDVGEPLVLAAMKRALERVKDNWGYMKGILQDWLTKEINTVEEADGEVLAFRNKQESKGSWVNKSGAREVTPDWLHERNKEQEEPQVKKETAEEAKVRKEIDEMLGVFASG